MIRPPARSLALMLSMFVLASCSENTAPLEPAGAGDLSPLAAFHPLPRNSWTAKAPLPGNEIWSGLAAGVRNNSAGQPIVYVFGGDDVELVMRRSIDAYNLATNTWTTKVSQFQGRETNGVGLIRGKLYISGGYGEGVPSEESMRRTLYAYDPAADRIVRKADMPRKTADGVTGVINNRLYVLSGTCLGDDASVCEDPVVRRLLYRYDPATDSWITLAPAPHSHANGVGGVIKGKFYVVGGSDTGNPNSSLDVYDPGSNTWRTLAPIPGGSRSLAAGAIQNTKLWVIDFNRNLYVYDPLTNRWTAKARMPAGGGASAAVPISTSQSHVFFVNVGGSGKPAPSQLYTP